MAVAPHGPASQGPSGAPSGRSTQAFVPQAFVSLGFPPTEFASGRLSLPSELHWLRQFRYLGRRERSVGKLLRSPAEGLCGAKGPTLAHRRLRPQQLFLPKEEICGAKSPTLVDGKDWSAFASSCSGGSAPSPPAQGWPKGQSCFAGPRPCAFIILCSGHFVASMAYPFGGALPPSTPRTPHLLRRFGNSEGVSAAGPKPLGLPPWVAAQHPPNGGAESEIRPVR